MTHKICFKAATKDIVIVPVASDTPEGFINIGDYAHATENDPLGAPGSHVLFHHIQKAMYPLGVQDMAYINVSFTREIESVPVTIVCVFPFDALLGDMTPLGADSKLVMDVTEQIGTYTYQGGLVAPHTAAAAPAGSIVTAARLPMSTHPVLIEAVLEVDTPVGVPVGPTGVVSSVQFYDATGLNGLRVQVSKDGAGVANTSVVKVTGGSSSLSYNSPTVVGSVFGIGVIGGVLHVFADGVPLVLSDTGIVAGDLLPILQVVEEAGLPVESLGLTAVSALRSAADAYAHRAAYAAVAAFTDACANAL